MMVAPMLVMPQEKDRSDMEMDMLNSAAIEN